MVSQTRDLVCLLQEGTRVNFSVPMRYPCKTFGVYLINAFNVSNSPDIIKSIEQWGAREEYYYKIMGESTVIAIEGGMVHRNPRCLEERRIEQV